MLKRFSDWLPLATVIALAITALFNVGFFSEVGIHFLGVVDLSNLAYTFGLSVGLAFTVIALIVQGALETAGKTIDYKREFDQFDYVSRYALTALVVLTFASFFLLKYVSWLISMRGFFLLVFFTCAVIGIRRVYLGYRRDGKPLQVDVIMSLFMIFIAVGTAGKYIAHTNVFEGPTYKVTSKSATFEGARIVRSSSSGFLIATDGLIRFIPAGEIIEIKADKPIQR